jgi:hypothetical protein
MPLSLSSVLEVLKKYPNVKCSQITGADVFYSDGSLSSAVAKLQGPNFSVGVFAEGSLLCLYGEAPADLQSALKEAAGKN